VPPVLAPEGDLGDLLAGAEAVEHGAAREPSLTELVVDAAAEVCQQVLTCLTSGFVDGEVG
jgi:hypothetical protein